MRSFALTPAARAAAPPAGRWPRVAAVGLASGALLGASTLPIDLGLVGFVALVPLLALVARGLSLREGLAAGYLCGLGWFGIGFAWCPFVDGASWRCWLLYAAYVPLVALSGAALGAALAMLRRLGPGVALAAAPALWLVLEANQGEFLDSGTAWLRLGHSLAPWPSLIQLAALGGVGLVSAWVVAVNAALAGASRLRPAARAVLAAALLAPWLAGAHVAGGHGAAESVRVAAVQPAATNAEQHAPAAFDTHLRRLLELGDAALERGPDLLVWPESAWPRPLGALGFDPFLATLVRDLGVPLVTGAQRVTGVRQASGEPALRNAALVLGAEGELRAVVDKVQPVPFYEAAPRSLAARTLARFGLWAGRFEAGEPSRVVLLGGRREIPIGVIVCFDITHPELVRALRRAGARLLVNPSNEAFSGAWSAVVQARIARLRAVENGVPIVRAANMGPSEWTDAHGRVVASLAAGARGAGMGEVVLAGAPTPYVRLGDAPAVVAVALSLLAAAGQRLRVSAAGRIERAALGFVSRTLEENRRTHARALDS